MAMGSGMISISTPSVDLFATFINSQIPAAFTPVHELVVQNNGSGTLRLADSGVNASSGYRLVPGDVFRIRLPGASRIFAISESGTAASISVLVVLE
jgi:hypothetical protein